MTESVVRDGWKLWFRQGAAIVRHELRVRLLRFRSVPLLAMALLPLALIALARWTVPDWDELQDPMEASTFFAVLYHVLILRTVVYFGSVWIFMNLFRQEILDSASQLYAFRPKIVFLATGWRDLMHTPPIRASRAEVRDVLDAEVAHWAALWRAAHERLGCHILVRICQAHIRPCPPSDPPEGRACGTDFHRGVSNPCKAAAKLGTLLF